MAPNFCMRTLVHTLAAVGCSDTKAEGQWNGDAQSRYHGVLAPNHRCRGLVTPARRGKGIKSIANAEVRTPALPHLAAPTRAPPESLPLFAGKGAR